MFTRLLLTGTLCCLVCLHWELRIEWQQGVYVRNKEWLRLSLLRRQSDHTEGEVPVDCCQLQVGVHRAPSHWYSLLPGLSLLPGRRCLRTDVASRTTIGLNFCDITDSFSIRVRLSTVGMNNVTITSAHVFSSQSTSFIDTITSFLTKNNRRL